MSDNLLMLLEMIEEVLEEQSQSLIDVVRNAIGEKNIEKTEEKKTNKFRIQLNDEAESRGAYAEKVKSAIEKYVGESQQLLPIFDSKGSTIVGYKIKTTTGRRKILFSYELKTSGTGIVESEAMESVIVLATGGNTGTAFTDQRAEELKNNTLPNIQKSVDKTPALKDKEGKIIPLTKQPDAEELSALYLSFDVKRKTPKTDLIDASGQLKYSVKNKKGAQFISAQGGESSAVWHVAALATAGGESNVDTAIVDVITEVTKNIKQEFSYDQWKQYLIGGSRSLERKQIYQKLRDELFKKSVEKIKVNSNDFEFNFITEAMTGNQKFDKNSQNCVANKTLSWDNTGGSFDVQDISTFIKTHDFRIRVSDRGGTRGGSLRGDILGMKSLKPTQVGMAEQLQTATPPDPSQQSDQSPPPVDYEELLNKAIDEHVENLSNFLTEKYFILKITRFLDYVRADEAGGLIDMVPLYEATTLKPEFGAAEEPDEEIDTTN